MTNRIALILGLLIIAIFAADYLYFGWNLPLVLGRLVVTFIEYVSFWR